jgi:hypothetical protein
VARACSSSRRWAAASSARAATVVDAVQPLGDPLDLGVLGVELGLQRPGLGGQGGIGGDGRGGGARGAGEDHGEREQGGDRGPPGDPECRASAPGHRPLAPNRPIRPHPTRSCRFCTRRIA